MSTAQILFGIWILKSATMLAIGTIVLWTLTAPTLRYARKINLISRRQI